jgi:hypothetical protein
VQAISVWSRQFQFGAGNFDAGNLFGAGNFGLEQAILATTKDKSDVIFGPC